MPFNVNILDTEQVKIHAGPWTSSVPGRAAKCYNFQVQVGGVSDPTGIVSLIPGPVDFNDPTFVIKPNFRFFGAPRQVTIVMMGNNQTSGGALIQENMTVTINGTLPDDGLLTQFQPSAEPPVPVS